MSTSGRTPSVRPSLATPAPLLAALATLAAAACVQDLADPGAARVSGAETVVGTIASGAARATLVIVNDWGAGYQVDVRMSNTGPATTSWTVAVNLGGSALSNGWNAALASSGGVLTARNLDWNKAIPAATTTMFGFQASGSGRPTLASFTITTAGGGTTTGAGGSGGAAGAGGRGGTGGTGGAAGAGGRGGAGGATAGSGGAAGTPGGGGTTFPPIATGCNGYATRFWDCCKPHCAWPGNVPGGVSPIRTCSLSNGTVDPNTQSACAGGGAFQCWTMAPWQVTPTLSYGFAATSNGDICGRCYQLQFTGTSFNAGNDPGSATLKGKTMVVQAMNIGGDVGNGQFDLLVPGGGVGQFNACSAQWGISASELGAQFGGFLATCKQQSGGNGAGLAALKSCVAAKCTSVFASRGLNDLAAGCRWFVDWFNVADNPALKFKEVACPAEITNRSSMNRTSRNDVSNACGS